MNASEEIERLEVERDEYFDRMHELRVIVAQKDEQLAEKERQIVLLDKQVERLEDALTSKTNLALEFETNLFDVRKQLNSMVDELKGLKIYNESVRYKNSALAISSSDVCLQSDIQSIIKKYEGNGK